MAPVRTCIERTFRFVGFALLAIAGFLLFAVAAVAMRPLLIAGLFLGGLACLALSRFSPSFRNWLDDVGQWQISYSGLRLATDVAVHPSHSWARIESDSVAVGADDFVPATLGPVEAVELPPVGRRFEQGERLFCVRRGDRSLALRAPVSGAVVARNEALLANPGLVNAGPFAEGWAVRLRADNIQKDRQCLLEGKQARRWFRQQIDRLIGTVLSGGSLMPALPDGGMLAPELYRQIDQSTWQRLTETFFEAGAPQA